MLSARSPVAVEAVRAYVGRDPIYEHRQHSRSARSTQREASVLHGPGQRMSRVVQDVSVALLQHVEKLLRWEAVALGRVTGTARPDEVPDGVFEDVAPGNHVIDVADRVRSIAIEAS